MEFTVAKERVDGFPIVEAKGEITIDGAISMGDFVRLTCADLGVSGAIVDCAAIEGALTAEELYDATPAFTAAVGQDLKVAYINPPPQWNAADDQFSRDLAYNRGGLLELFESAEQAVDWLNAP